MMSEPTLTVAILGSVYSMFCYSSQKEGRYLFLSGVCCGFAIIIKVVSAILLPLVPIYLLVVSPRSGKIRTVQDIMIWFLFPVVLFCGAQLAYNEIRYGSWLSFGYSLGRDAFGFRTPLYVGLWGYFLSPGKSFFLYNPIAVLGLVGLGRFFSWRRAETLFFLVLCGLFVFIHAKWWAWAGDWAWGPRFLLVLTPFLILPCGMIVENWPRASPLTKTAIVIFMGLSFSVQVLGVFVHPFSFIHARTVVLNHLVGQSLVNWGAYSREYIENAIVNFSPMFSHIVGNFWLFKHMLFSYDLWVDAPWTVLGNTPLPAIPMVLGNRTVPDWWPVAFPLLFPGSNLWIWPLATANALVTALFGFRLSRILRSMREPDTAV
ncbi:MAG: hypothetical protein JEZ11_06375 [Desulfobacterales bacterium]|nr:hypothetical protein [Desulfobacterales bacterium]